MNKIQNVNSVLCCSTDVYATTPDQILLAFDVDTRTTIECTVNSPKPPSWFKYFRKGIALTIAVSGPIPSL